MSLGDQLAMAQQILNLTIVIAILNAVSVGLLILKNEIL